MITKAALEKTLPHLLRPIVRLCVRYALKINEVENVLKTIFIQEAKYLIETSGGVSNQSKLSVMTGIQRHSIPAESDNIEIPLRSQNLLMKVLGAWQTKNEYLTIRKKPRILSIEGKQSEFAQLVHSVSQSLNPYTVLFELERAQLVVKTRQGLKLVSGSFIVRKDVEETLNFLATDIVDLTKTVEDNINANEKPSHHHLTTEFDNVPESKINEIKLMLLEEGDKLHSRMRTMLGQHDQDIIKARKTDEKSYRVAFCSFSRTEETHIER